MKRKNNNSSRLIFRSISLVVCVTMVMVFSLMSVYADTLDVDFSKVVYQVGVSDAVNKDITINEDHKSGRIVLGGYPYSNTNVDNWGALYINTRDWGNINGSNYWSSSLQQHVMFFIAPVSVDTFNGLEVVGSNVIVHYGLTRDSNGRYFFDSTLDGNGYALVEFDLSASNQFNQRLFVIHNYSNRNANAQVVIDFKIASLVYNGVVVLDYEPLVEPAEPKYYTYSVPYGSYLHVETPDGGTVQTTVKTAKNVGSYISYPKFNGLRISYDNNNLNSYGYSRATNIALTPAGSKGNLGGANVFESDWLSVADSVNIYNGFDDEFSTNYSVQVTVYASNPKVIWYSPTTTSEVVSGDYSAVTNTGGAVNLSGGNGTVSSPYYVTPTNNDGGRVDYAEIGTNPQGNEITQSLAEQIISVFTVPVQAMNDIVSGSKDFMSALSGLYSWLPEELRTPVAGAFTAILTVGIIKVLL